MAILFLAWYMAFASPVILDHLLAVLKQAVKPEQVNNWYIFLSLITHFAAIFIAIQVWKNIDRYRH